MQEKINIINVNKLVIQGQEFEMTITELKELRELIDEIVGEKVKVVTVQPPIFFPDIQKKEDDYKTIKPYKPWRTEDIYYPKIWCKDKVTVTM